MPGVLVRMPSAVLGALDGYIAARPDPKPSRPEAIRSLLNEALTTKGPLTGPAITQRIEVLEAKVASIPEHDGEPSPQAAMDTMKRALAEAELKGLKKRVRKSKAPR